MRYAAGLRHSRRQHALHAPAGGGTALLWLLGLLVVFLSISSVVSIQPAEFLLDLGVSFLRVSVAYAVALVLAVALALAVTARASVETALLPILDSLQSFPSFALFPLLADALERSPESVIITVLVITMIWPILFTLIGAMKNRREHLEEAATLFGATGWRRLGAFTLPQLWPAIVTGSIVGWGEGWEFIIGAELLVHVRQGVGQYFGALGETHQSVLLAVGILLLMLFLFVMNKLFWLPILDHATRYESD